MGGKCTKPELHAAAAAGSTSPRLSSAPSDSEKKGFRSGLVRSSIHRSVWEVYDKGKKLGSGMTGDVFQVMHKVTNQAFALKSMERRKINPDLIEDLRNEIAILKMLDHPNVIKLYETYEDSDNIYLVLELCTGGELYDRLHAQEGRHFREAEAARLVFKMLSAIAYCHKKGISHRDLKLENFIFDSDAVDSNLKLIDFGLSKKYGTEIRRMQTMVGTPYYMAPEVAADSGTYTEMCDEWSVGVITYMLLTGTPPFRGDKDEAVLNAVKAAKYVMTGPRWEHISDAAKDFVSCLLRKNPKHRLTAEQALRHPWLRATEDAIRSMTVARSVVDSLKRFRHYSTMKKVALEAIAFSLTAAQVQDMRRAFVKIDQDMSGFVSQATFVSILVKEGVPAEEAEVIFRHMDRDGKGAVSYSEFLGATLDRKYFLQADRIREAFQRLDVRNTGYISADDLKFVMGDDFNEGTLRTMLAEADVGSDGKIDFQDFLRIVADETQYGTVPEPVIARSPSSSEEGSKLGALSEEDSEFMTPTPDLRATPLVVSEPSEGKPGANYPRRADVGALGMRIMRDGSSGVHGKVIAAASSDVLDGVRPAVVTATK